MVGTLDNVPFGHQSKKKERPKSRRNACMFDHFNGLFGGTLLFDKATIRWSPWKGRTQGPWEPGSPACFITVPGVPEFGPVRRLICHQFSWLFTRESFHSQHAMDDHLFPIPSNLTQIDPVATGEAKQFWSETNTLWGLGSRPTGPTGLRPRLMNDVSPDRALAKWPSWRPTAHWDWPHARSFVRCFMVLSTWSTRLVKFLSAYLLKVVLLGELGNIWQLETTNPLILNSKWHILMLIWPEWRPFWSHQKDSTAIEAVMRKATRRP